MNARELVRARLSNRPVMLSRSKVLEPVVGQKTVRRSTLAKGEISPDNRKR